MRVVVDDHHLGAAEIELFDDAEPDPLESADDDVPAAGSRFRWHLANEEHLLIGGE